MLNKQCLICKFIPKLYKRMRLTTRLYGTVLCDDVTNYVHTKYVLTLHYRLVLLTVTNSINSAWSIEMQELVQPYATY